MSDNLPVLLGGSPACPAGPPSWPIADDDVLRALQDAHADGSWGKYQGGHVEKLEASLAHHHGVPFAIVCASGTFAVETALRAVKVGPGDEVIQAAYDFAGNFLGIHAIGARPVLVDVDPGNWNLDPARLEGAIGPVTRAVLVSHLHGGMVPMRRVLEIAGRHGVAVVEDAAQVPGAMIDGRRAGTWGDAGVLSFGGSKLLTAGRGGALLTARADVHQRARTILQRGNLVAPLSELQAAVLLPQLAKLDQRNAVRAANVALLFDLLRDVPGLTPFINEPAAQARDLHEPAAQARVLLSTNNEPAAQARVLLSTNNEPAAQARDPLTQTQPAYYKVGFQYDSARFGLPRDRFLKAVRAEGIAMDEGFKSLHVGRSASRFRAGGTLDEADRAHVGTVVLHHPVLLGPRSAIEEVALAVKKVSAHARQL